MPPAAPCPQTTGTLRWRAVVAIAAGNALEWFDFIIFGFFAAVIARQFFPAESEAASLLLTFATFGVAFVMRPLGAVMLGHYADRNGRKPAMTLTIGLMMAGTGIIAITPPYASIGLAAPALIVVSRLLQGFSAGGEFGSATAFLAEQNPERRGFLASWQFFGQALAAVLATLSGVLLTGILSEDELERWGWRVPFLFGLLIGPVAYYIRRRVAESPEFSAAQARTAPLRELVSQDRARLLTAIGTVIVATVATYTLLYMPTFAVRQLGLPLSQAFAAALSGSVLQLFVVPLAGALSDRWGRRPIAIATTAILLATSFPVFVGLTLAPTFASLLLFHIFVGAVLAAYCGVLPALLAELFPARKRTSGLAISYALAVTLFGGFAPLISASLVSMTGTQAAAGLYLASAAALTLVALYHVPRRTGVPHSD